MTNRHRDKTETQIKEMFDKMSNTQILKEYPTTIPLRLAAILMNIPEADMRYGINSNSPRFQFGIPIQKKRTRFRIDTKLFLETIPQRRGK